MNKVWILLAFVLCAFAQDSEPCTYLATDGSFYDFGYLNDGNWLQVTDENNNVWNVNLCPEEDEESCGQLNTTVCETISSTEVLRGMTSTASYSDSPNGANQGVEIIFSADSFKTVVELVCNPTLDESEANIKIQTASDNSMATITIESFQGCPLTDDIFEDSHEDDDEDDQSSFNTKKKFHSVLIFPLVAGLIVFCCACCCCLIRRRRCNQQRQCQFKNFSNAAFQPIPQSSAPSQSPNSSVMFNPYMSQPMQTMNQVYYYNPSTEAYVPSSPSQVPLTTSQVQEDERLARQIQAQLNME